MIYERLVPLKNREVLLWSCREPKGVMKSCLLRAKPTFYVIQISGQAPGPGAMVFGLQATCPTRQLLFESVAFPLFPGSLSQIGALTVPSARIMRRLLRWRLSGG